MNIIKILVFCIMFQFQLLSALQYDTPPKPMSIITGDFDGDGDNDLVIGYTYFEIEAGYCYYEFENGTCIDTLNYNLPGSHYNIIAEKIDSNDFLDLVLLSQSNNQSYVAVIYDFLHESEATILYPIYGNIKYIHVCDISQNNLLDIVFTTTSDNQIGIIYNQGFREFSEAEYINIGSRCTAIACGEINNDSRPDIVYVGVGGTKIIYNLTTEFEIYQYSNNYNERVELVDFDHDGDNDIFASSYGLSNLTVTRYIENCNEDEFIDHGALTLTPTTGMSFLLDINLDNHYDFIGADIFGICSAINSGDYSFYPTTFYEVPMYYEIFYGFNSGDMNNDGLEDILFASGDETGGILTILYSDGYGNLLEEPDIQNVENVLEQPHNVLTSYPNPLYQSSTNQNSSTTISYSLNKKKNAIIEIYDIKGRLVNELKSNNNKSVIWEGTDFTSNRVSSGVYFLLLKSEGVNLATKKITLMK